MLLSSSISTSPNKRSPIGSLSSDTIQTRSPTDARISKIQTSAPLSETLSLSKPIISSTASSPSKYQPSTFVTSSLYQESAITFETLAVANSSHFTSPLLHGTPRSQTTSPTIFPSFLGTSPASEIFTSGIEAILLPTYSSGTTQLAFEPAKTPHSPSYYMYRRYSNVSTSVLPSSSNPLITDLGTLLPSPISVPITPPTIASIPTSEGHLASSQAMNSPSTFSKESLTSPLPTFLSTTGIQVPQASTSAVYSRSFTSTILLLPALSSGTPSSLEAVFGNVGTSSTSTLSLVVITNSPSAVSVVASLSQSFSQSLNTESPTQSALRQSTPSSSLIGSLSTFLSTSSQGISALSLKASSGQPYTSYTFIEQTFTSQSTMHSSNTALNVEASPRKSNTENTTTLQISISQLLLSPGSGVSTTQRSSIASLTLGVSHTITSPPISSLTTPLPTILPIPSQNIYTSIYWNCLGGGGTYSSTSQSYSSSAETSNSNLEMVSSRPNLITSWSSKTFSSLSSPSDQNVYTPTFESSKSLVTNSISSLIPATTSWHPASINPLPSSFQTTSSLAFTTSGNNIFTRIYWGCSDSDTSSFDSYNPSATILPRSNLGIASSHPATISSSSQMAQYPSLGASSDKTFSLKLMSTAEEASTLLVGLSLASTAILPTTHPAYATPSTPDSSQNTLTSASASSREGAFDLSTGTSSKLAVVSSIPLSTQGDSTSLSLRTRIPSTLSFQMNQSTMVLTSLSYMPPISSLIQTLSQDISTQIYWDCLGTTTSASDTYYTSSAMMTAGPNLEMASLNLMPTFSITFSDNPQTTVLPILPTRQTPSPISQTGPALISQTILGQSTSISLVSGLLSASQILSNSTVMNDRASPTTSVLWDCGLGATAM
ncbi:hypothetical protein EG329_012401 [Mollisiaceae sp. DMI_Dod_QoI]|nr:hypothetical protein EG329_012401 [Helotiales sp. DMI_Dod_QoI]